MQEGARRCSLIQRGILRFRHTTGALRMVRDREQDNHPSIPDDLVSFLGLAEDVVPEWARERLRQIDPQWFEPDKPARRRRRYPLGPGELRTKTPHEDEDRATGVWLYLEAVKKHVPEALEAEREWLDRRHPIPAIGPLPMEDDEEPPRYDPAEQRADRYLRDVKAYMRRQEARREAQGYEREKGRLQWDSAPFEALVLFDIRMLSLEDVRVALRLRSRQAAAAMIRRVVLLLDYPLRKPLPGRKKPARASR